MAPNAGRFRNGWVCKWELFFTAHLFLLYSTVALTNTRRANPGRQDLVIVISVRRTAGMLRSTGSRNAGMPD